MQEDNVFNISGIRLLKSKAIYGANASGKSNLIKAVGAFSLMVHRSVRQEGLSKLIWEERFRLISDWDDQPIFFQYLFLLDKIIYRYGFQILNGAISHEWLFQETGSKKGELFVRTPDGFTLPNNRFEGAEKFVEQQKDTSNELFRPDSLFLTAAALSGNKFAQKIRNEIIGIITVDGIEDDSAVSFAMDHIAKNPKRKASIEMMLSAADTMVEGVEVREFKDAVAKKAAQPNIPEDLLTDNTKILQGLFSSHSIYNENGEVSGKISVPFGEWESQGTGKMLSIGSLILDSLQNGRIIFIDEFDARLHPNLTLKLVELFHNNETNPNHSQLIFVTHDAGLLRRAKLRRDQICFIDKDRYGVASIRNLIQFKGVRKDESYEKEYLSGTYHGVPFLEKLEKAVKSSLKVK